jgi:hypothetical protein
MRRRAAFQKPSNEDLPLMNLTTKGKIWEDAKFLFLALSALSLPCP